MRAAGDPSFRPRLNTAIGRFCLFIYAGFSFDALKPKHMRHHAAPGTATDPDYCIARPDSFLHWYARFYREYFGLREFAILTVLLAIHVFVLGAAIPNLLLFWAVPALLSSLQLFCFGTYRPHRPVPGEVFADRHLSPPAPWWRLPALRRQRVADASGARRTRFKEHVNPAPSHCVPIRRKRCAGGASINMILRPGRSADNLGTTAAAAAAAGILLAACSFTPDMPQETARVLPGAGDPFVTASVAPVSGGQPRDAWWRLFDDAALDRHIAEAFARNNDLKAAAANLRQVRAALGESRSAFLPSTEVSAGAAYTRDAAQRPALQADDEELEYSAGFSLSYEIDLWGRVRSSVSAARADAAGAEAALHAARITVAAETARAYADICAANQQIAVTEETLALQTRTVDLTRQLSEGGQGTVLDIVRAQVNVENTRATLPRLKADRENARFRLATLTGQPPRAMLEAATDCAAAPQVADVIPVGDGAGLLARRPDVREAEQRLAAAAARVGVATAELYPSITLGGNVSADALQIASLKEDGAISFSAGPLISWTFPNVWAARARMRGAAAGMERALAEFDQTVLTALEETEVILQDYAAELARIEALTAARDAAADAARMAQARYELGADDFITVLDSERTLAEAEIDLARAQAQVTQLQIGVFKALGGGWADAAAGGTASAGS